MSGIQPRRTTGDDLGAGNLASTQRLEEHFGKPGEPRKERWEYRLGIGNVRLGPGKELGSRT